MPPHYDGGFAVVFMPVTPIEVELQMRLVQNLAAIMVLALAPTAAMALPILSADGSTLTGVEVAGFGTYDVMFGDGIVGDVYAGVTFDAARETEANAVSDGIVDALSALGIVDPAAIAGCDGTSPIGCLLFNPERAQRNEPFQLLDLNTASITPTQGPKVSDLALIRSPTDDTEASVGTTLVTYAPASVSVPTPAPQLLIGLGLALLVVRRRQSAVSS